MHRNTRLLLLVLAIAMALVVLKVIDRNEQFKPSPVTNAQAATTTVNQVKKPLAKPAVTKKEIVYPKHIQVSMDEAIIRLSACESGGDPNMKIVDSNDYWSRGILQFQYPTFRKFGIQYGFITSTTTYDEIVSDMFNPKMEISFIYSPH